MLRAMNDSLLERILTGLNEAQRAAVTSPPRGQIQVIAGPGTGKTKVLTSRVAYLLLNHNMAPEDIIVTTFTKKAANELKERLLVLLDGSGVKIERLLMGTFHSICVRILKRYGYLINLNGFKVSTERDSMDILRGVIEASEAELKNIKVAAEATGKKPDFLGGKNNKIIEPKYIRAKISSLKSKGLRPLEYRADPHCLKSILLIYERYQEKLGFLNRLDFDDLLLTTKNLLGQYKVLRSIQYVLIDEFQDTNTLQFDLMRSFGYQNVRSPDNITVVGDPDQSIYAFRDAVSQNFEIMREVYKNCKIIMLNENYRSTKDILDFSESFMHQQEGRQLKNLRSQYEESFPPVYNNCHSNFDEADQIANEIAQLKDLPDLYNYSDFAVLVRAAHLSRVIETALVKKRIPYTVVKGRAFWERKEVSLMIDFLRVVADRSDITALMRALSESTVGIGAKGIQTLTQALEREWTTGVQPLQALRGVADGTVPAPRVPKDKVDEFLGILASLFRCYDIDPNDQSIILEVFDKIKELSVFVDLFKDNDEKRDNITEVRLQLEEFNPDDERELYVDDDDDEDVLEVHPEESYLQKFITSVNLYLTQDNEEHDGTQGKVSISTIHAAKGLEWPVVFIPGLLDGTLPSLHPTADDEEGRGYDEIEEERRVFYVSTTRAKHLLFLSSGPRLNSDHKESRFLTGRTRNATVQKQRALKNCDELAKLYKIVGVPVPVRDVLDSHCQGYQRYEAEKYTSRGELYGDNNDENSLTSLCGNAFNTQRYQGVKMQTIPTHGIHYSNQRFSRAPSYTPHKDVKKTNFGHALTLIGNMTIPPRLHSQSPQGRLVQRESNSENGLIGALGNEVAPKRRKTLGMRRRRV